jgi:hypothetical protein
MKKLLLILLCLPLLFTTCKKEDEEPANNANNGETFLSINDGSVWVCQETDPNAMAIMVGGDSLIGFYNAENFIYNIWEEKWDSSIICDVITMSGQPPTAEAGGGLKVETITNTPNELTFSLTFMDEIGEPNLEIIRSYTGSQNLIISEVTMNTDTGSFLINPNYARTYVRSTELQNLTCP